MFIVNITVGEDDVVHTLVHAPLCLMTEVVDRLAQAFLALLRVKDDGKLLRLEPLIPYIT